MSTEQTHPRQHRHPGPGDFPGPRAVQDRDYRQARTVAMVVDLLRGNDIRCAITGDWAASALGGPPTDHSVEIAVTPIDAPRACSVLVSAGLRTVGCLDGRTHRFFADDHRVHVVFRRPGGGEVTAALLEHTVRGRIGDTTVPVLAPTEVMIDKLDALGRQRHDFVPLVQIARQLAEHVDWAAVAAATAQSRYARVFLGLLADLSITSDSVCVGGRGRPHLPAADTAGPRATPAAGRARAASRICHRLGGSGRFRIPALRIPILLQENRSRDVYPHR